MRLKGVVLFLLLSTLSSCSTEKEAKGILSKGQMADWLIDVYMAEARLQALPIVRDSSYKIFLPYQDSLLRKKGLQDSVIQKSYRYYLEHPKDLEAIYDIVIDSLSLREQRLLPAGDKL